MLSGASAYGTGRLSPVNMKRPITECAELSCQSAHSVMGRFMDAGGRVPAPGTNVVLSWAPESTFVVDRAGLKSEEEDA